jgi:FMN phosphatase YigB (HAD superfamily)
MSLTILFDLDDTLLDNDIDQFLPGYLKALAKHLETWIPPQRLIQQLLASTGRMTANTDPSVTLEEAFDADFYPALGKTKAELSGPIVDFYERGFPSLKGLTKPREAARRLVEALFERGHQIVVATNPLFPRRAITHRLDWAGLPVERYPFALVTSYETFHFSKPNPAYYAEILAQLGWPSQPVVMVGNSLSDDLRPAAQLGIPCFWIRGGQEGTLEGLPVLSGQGGLEDVLAWLDSVVSQLSSGSVYENPDALLAVMRSTPAAMDTFSRALRPDQWNRQIAPQEWCYTEILCHLRDSDREINHPRVDTILAEESPFITPVDADAWSLNREYCGEDGPAALRGFMESRASLLDKLVTLTPSDWERPARHSIFGPTNLRELLAFSATHDRSHVGQALATLRAAVV